MAAEQKLKKNRPPTPTYIYVPANFDPQAALPPDLWRYADCARYFLHRIIWGTIMRRLTPAQYVPIKFDYLRAVIPDRVIKPLKVALLEEEVIECDDHYIEGTKSLAYRLGPRYQDARILRLALGHQPTADKLLANRLAEHKKVRLDVHKHLRRWYWRLEINLPLALELLTGDPSYELLKVPAEQIAGRDFSFTVCSYGRVHTDLTRCSRKIRPALHIDGQPLVSIDIANSQPLFLSLLVLNFRKNGNKTFVLVSFDEKKKNPYLQLDQILQQAILPFTQKEENTTTPHPPASITTRKEDASETENSTESAVTTTDKNSEMRPVNNEWLRPDEEQFLRLCEQGRLYEHFMGRLRIPKRDWAKEQFFEFAYGRNSFQSPFKTLFTAVFPGVADVIRLHKKKDYTFLPCLMQNVEANFIINRVCRRLMNEHPEIPVLTIHDCLLTTAKHAETIQRVMREEFDRLGISPTLHVKRYERGHGHQAAPDGFRIDPFQSVGSEVG